MKVLLTGGSGFIGHHVVDHLLAETDWEIIVLDSLSYAGDISKVVELSGFDPQRVRGVWPDLRAPIPPATAGRIGAVDAMFNLASASHVPHSIDDPVPFVQNNVNVALHMLGLPRQHPPELFVQFSTAGAFGRPPREGSSRRGTCTFRRTRMRRASRLRNNSPRAIGARMDCRW